MMLSNLGNPVSAERFCEYFENCFQGSMREIGAIYSKTTTTWRLAAGRPLSEKTITEALKEFARLCNCECVKERNTDKWILSLPLGITVAEVIAKIQSQMCAEITLATYKPSV